MSAPHLNPLNCTLAGSCSGCDRLHLDRQGLEQDRRAELAELRLDHVPIDFVWIADGKLRDRLEFTLEPETVDRMRLGLFDTGIQGERTLLDIEICPQLTPALQAWLSDFRKDLPRVAARRSVRLRVSPSGLRGVWLDFANEDIRDLLDEGSWLQRRLDEKVIVEVGQKRKRVTTNSEGPRAHKLVDPILEPWFETLMQDSTGKTLQPVPLYATVGTFTQPGFESTRALVRTVLDHVSTTGRDFSNFRIAEFGAGIGCFTLPLLSTGAHVDVFETDRLALSALARGVENAGLDTTKLTVHAGDFIQSGKAAERAFRSEGSSDPTKAGYDIVVVDPPRPGLGQFVDSIASRADRANWIYVSCYPESFAKDVEALRLKGLHLDRLTVVEQFPFTRHFEIVGSFLCNAHADDPRP